MRFLTAIWGFWFAAAFLELPVLHACPVHAGAVAVGQDSGSAGAHAHHHGAPASDQPDEGTQCTCLSHCSGASPVALAPRTTGVEPSVSEPARIAVPPRAVILVARPHARPYANGPPVA